MSNRQQKPPVRELPEGHSLRADVSISHEKAVGRVAIAWAKLEGALDQLIWAIFSLPMRYGRVITTKLDANGKTQMLRSLAPLAFKPEHSASLIQILGDIDNLRGDRNLILHGLWATSTPDGFPVALSMRPNHVPEAVVGEVFTVERMRLIVLGIDSSKNRLPDFMKHIRKLSS